jgi:hypothetical protein
MSERRCNTVQLAEQRSCLDWIAEPAPFARGLGVTSLPPVAENVRRCAELRDTDAAWAADRRRARAHMIHTNRAALHRQTRTNVLRRLGVCTSGICQAATCSDGVKNGSETGVDQASERQHRPGLLDRSAVLGQHLRRVFELRRDRR